MREWLIIAVGLVIGVTICILISETFELSREVGRIVAIGGAFFGACLTMGIATMAGWVKSPREWLIVAVGVAIGGTIGITISEVFELSRIATRIAALGSAAFCVCLTMGIATMAGWIKPLSDNT